MTQPSATPKTPGGSRSPVAAHPVTSAVIAILILASIFFAVWVPLYASTTPKIGDFPFFYFYLLAYMPVVGVVLGIVLFLQNRLRAPADAGAPGSGSGLSSGSGEVAR